MLVFSYFPAFPPHNLSVTSPFLRLFPLALRWHYHLGFARNEAPLVRVSVHCHVPCASECYAIPAWPLFQAISFVCSLCKRIAFRCRLYSHLLKLSSHSCIILHFWWWFKIHFILITIIKWIANDNASLFAIQQSICIIQLQFWHFTLDK